MIISLTVCYRLTLPAALHTTVTGVWTRWWLRVCHIRTWNIWWKHLTMTVKVSKPSHQQQSRVFRYEQLVCLRSLVQSRNKEFILDSGKWNSRVPLCPLHHILSSHYLLIMLFHTSKIPICFNLIKNSFICPTNRNMSVSQQDGNITINNHNRKTWTILWKVKNQMAE